ncbi:MAG: DUF3006 domain-containing protein [Ruminococcus sp.]
MIIIDRFEGDLAVLETDSGMIQAARSLLPENAQEGDILTQTADGYTVDAEATQARREKLLARMKRIKKQ